ncbi:MAG TPA: bifunctional diguanylate cyclase/phosphodiesterase, partial [Gemmatimonadota bacterium]|nr:bifunctional diguanylate cyclase/phosphodiesterase [Gemmatimonadota bacterium]
LWGVHLVPVAILAYREGITGAIPAVLISVVLVLIGEYVLATSALVPQAPGAADVLALATTFSDVLVAILALYARSRAHDLRDAAFRDHLTGLPNRRLFMDRLGHRVAQARRQAGVTFGVLFLDLDSFKLINDSLGHAIGNEVLQRTARRIERCLREVDTVTRWGGDEFVILLDEVEDSADAERVARRIFQAFEIPVEVEGHRVQLDVSVGIAVSSDGELDPEALVGQADTAMYQAKGRGKARLEIFDRSMHEQARTRLELETELHHAVERAEFLLHYQPLVALEDDTIAGFEALVRWRHPGRGVLSPQAFLEVAEDTGLVVPLGSFVLREAARALASWRRRYGSVDGLTMGVNVSARQLSRGDFVDMVADACREFDLPPDHLNLEITETTLVENADLASRTLEKLRELGVQLSIDDFGTGYSSLEYLQRFPVHRLKIDRSFVNVLGSRRQSPAILRAVVAMGRELGIRTVAEGVETREQRDIVRSVGCDYGQGHHFCPPLVPQESEELVRRIAAANRSDASA